MLNEKSPVSLYFQLKEILIKRIKDNDWPLNTRIPPERELCRMYQISRITVRQALDAMEKEGYLYRKQGKGTFVRVPKLEQRLGNFYSFSEEIRKMGALPTAEVLECLILASNEKIANYLSIEAGEKIHSLSRLRKADHEPFALETSYIPVSLAANLDKGQIEKNGLYNTLRDQYGILPDEAEESFEAVLLASEHDAQLLHAKKNDAALRIERVTKTRGVIIEYCTSLVRGDRYKYRVVLK